MEQIEFPIVIDGVAEVMVTLEVYDEDDQRVCGIYEIRGRINVPPKRWLSLIRGYLRQIEEYAKESGVTEMRLGGRDWSPILKDYEPFDSISNGLRKRL